MIAYLARLPFRMARAALGVVVEDLFSQCPDMEVIYAHYEAMEAQALALSPKDPP